MELIEAKVGTEIIEVRSGYQLTLSPYELRVMAILEDYISTRKFITLETVRVNYLKDHGVEVKYNWLDERLSSLEGKGILERVFRSNHYTYRINKENYEKLPGRLKNRKF